jgi:ABC-type dipeptide/oligopeptide/nickel transport system ATPase component
MENTQNNTDEILLDVRHLRTQFNTDEGIARAVEDVSFYVNKGETLGIVGESGCGKSVTALSILQLAAGKITGGEILLENTDLLKLTAKQMKQIRGKEITMIFQDPMTSLDPVYTIGFQLQEAVLQHEKMSKKSEQDCGSNFEDEKR